MQKASCFGGYIMNSCIFCQENRFRNNLKVGLTFSESMLFENKHIYVTPDLSPLVPGHLLIVSQEHYNSFASAPMEVQDALQKAIKYIYNNFNFRYLTWFEHGAVFPGKGGASIDHAHLHVLPYDIPIKKLVEFDNLYLQKLSYTEEIFNTLAEKQPYLWIGNGFNLSSIYYVDNLPSQYLRNVVTRLLGNESYNWKNNFMQEESLKKYRETLEIIRGN